jgi:hypothetical protein
LVGKWKTILDAPFESSRGTSLDSALSDRLNVRLGMGLGIKNWFRARNEHRCLTSIITGNRARDITRQKVGNKLGSNLGNVLGFELGIELGLPIGSSLGIELGDVLVQDLQWNGALGSDLVH